MTKHLKFFVVMSMAILSIVVGQYSSSLNVEAFSLRSQSSPISTNAETPSSVLVQTVRGSGDWIYTRRSTNCGVSWSTWVKDGQMYGSSDTVSFYDLSSGSAVATLVQTVRGAGNWIYTRTSLDGQTWSSWVKDGQMFDDSDTVAFYDYSTGTPVAKLVQTVRGAGDWIYTRTSSNGQSWSDWVKNGQMYGASDTVAIYDYNGVNPVAKLVQTVRGAGDWIYTRTSLDGQTWSAWAKSGQMYDISDTLDIYNTVSVPPVSRLVQTVKGSGNWIYTRVSDDFGQTWSAWGKNGQMFSPSSTSIIQNKLVQTVRGSGDWIYTRTSTNGFSWSNWVKDGQMLDRVDTETCYDPSTTSNKLVQTIRGTGNWIYSRTTTDGLTWTNWVKDGQMLSPSDTVELY